jgi:ABC-2 type transport system permease protein
MTVFSSNIWWLPFYINKGDLDYYLIRPISSLYFVSVREFSANSFVNLLIAAGFFIYSLMNYSGEITFLKFLFLVALIINGTLLHYTIQVLMVLPVFWTHSAKGFIDLFYSLSMAMERPHRIYRGFLRIIFTTLLPFALIASFPAALFLEAFSGETLLHLILISGMMWGLLLLVWSKGLKAYSSASS